MSDPELFNHPPSDLETFLIWFGNHWILGIILLLTVSWMFVSPFRFLYLAYRARQRYKAIEAQGWPPETLEGEEDED